MEEIANYFNEIKDFRINAGFIDQIINNKPHFIHRTFAEFLVDNFFYNSLQIESGLVILEFLLKEILLKPDYQGIRTFLNNQFEKTGCASTT